MANEARKRFNQFLRNCIEEVINCHGNPEWIAEELDFARIVYADLDAEAYAKGRAWVEGAARTKARRRSRQARQKLAVVLTHHLSKKAPNAPGLDPELRQRRLEQLRGGWIAVTCLLGLNLTQIESCRLVFKRGCSCQKTCRKVNFSRDWADVEQGCQQCWQALNDKGNHHE